MKCNCSISNSIQQKNEIRVFKFKVEITILKMKKNSKGRE
jgi:hypothetical protein